MPLATSTTEGDIVLSGDFAGSNDPHSPELTSTGVTAGTYILPDLVVDCKGRVLYADNWSAPIASNNLGALLQPSLPISTKSTPCSEVGIMQVGDSLSITDGVLTLSDSDIIASDLLVGLVSIGDGLDVALDGTLSTAISNVGATKTTRGFIQIGNNLSVVDGVVSLNSVDLGVATNQQPGAFSIGTGIGITNQGMLFFDDSFLPIATNTTHGRVSIGIGLKLDPVDGDISIGQFAISIDTDNLTPGSKTNRGVISVESGEIVEGGSISLPLNINVDGLMVLDQTRFRPASNTERGVVQIGSGLDINNGTISYDFNNVVSGSTNNLGFIQVGDFLQHDSGVISMPDSAIPSASPTQLGIVEIGNTLGFDGTSISFDPTSIPDATKSSYGYVGTDGGSTKIENDLLTLSDLFPYAPNGSIQGAIRLSDAINIDGDGDISVVDLVVTSTSTNVFSANVNHHVEARSYSNGQPLEETFNYFKFYQGQSQNIFLSNIRSEGAIPGREIVVMFDLISGVTVTLDSGYVISQTSPDTVIEGEAIVTITVRGIDDYLVSITSNYS
jgi:hypothetical protein